MTKELSILDAGKVCRVAAPVILALIACLVRIPLAQSAEAASAKEKGEEIAAEMDRKDSGFGDITAVVEMVLTDPDGRSSRRRLRVMTLEVTSDKDGDKSLIEFRSPPDIRGTTLLSFSHFQEDDDQWLFLPALKRVKRISSSNKSGPFVGSEFAYEDMMSQEHQRYEHKWLKDEPCGTSMCFVVQRTPKYDGSGYTFQKTWVDQTRYHPVKIEFYDRKKELLKTLTYNNYRLYLGRYWRAHTLSMKNHQSKRGTTLIVKNYEFRRGLAETDFRPDRLRNRR